MKTVTTVQENAEDTLQYYLRSQEMVVSAKVYERTCDAAVVYKGRREEILELLKGFRYEDTEVPAGILENSGRQLNGSYQTTSALLHNTSTLAIGIKSMENLL